MAIVETKVQFRALLAEVRKLKLGSRFVLDTETTGLDMFGLADRYEVPMGRPGGPDGALLDPEVGPARVCGVAFGIPYGKGIRTWYLPYRHENDVLTYLPPDKKTGTSKKCYEHHLKQKQLPLDTLPELVASIERNELTWVNHNVKFDAKQLYADNAMPNEDKVKFEDTMLLAHILDERHERYTLENLVEFYTDHPMKYKSWAKITLKERRFRRYSQFTVEELATYAEDDVRGTWKLHQALYPHLTDPAEPWYAGLSNGQPDPEEKLKKLFESEMKTLWVTTWMEIQGMMLDKKLCATLAKDLDKDLTRVVAKMESLAPGLNPLSFPQMKAFWESKGWPLAVDPLRNSVTFQDVSLYKLLPSGPNKEPLEHPKHPGMKDFISLLVQVRSVRKFKETYLENYLRLADGNGYLHPNYLQHGTVTGRLSSSQPNFQNIPKTIATGRTALQRAAEEIVHSPVRQVIIPRSSHHRLVNIDFNQQEIRLFLHYVDEPKMRAIVAHSCEKTLRGEDCIDGDVHHYAASQMFGGMPDPDKEPDEYKRRRHMAKFINFGIIYGMGRRKLAEMFELSPAQSDEYYRGYLDAFPHIKEFIETVRGVADERTWVANAFGRRRRMRLLTSEEKRTGLVRTGLGYTASVRSTDSTADAHKALNAIIQGGAADMVKIAMVRCHALLRNTNSYLVNQIHDELVFELHNDEIDELLPKIKIALTDWPQFKIPFTVKVSIAEGAWSTSKASKV